METTLHVPSAHTARRNHIRGLSNDTSASMTVRPAVRWSPSRGAWVRMLNNGARYAAKLALGLPY
jgi:hypothetical protein